MRLDHALLSSPASGGLRLTPPVMALPLELPKPLDFSRVLSASPLETSSEFLLRAAERSDVDELATLCTDSFFCTHELADGPIIFLQRLMSKRLVAFNSSPRSPNFCATKASEGTSRTRSVRSARPYKP